MIISGSDAKQGRAAKGRARDGEASHGWTNCFRRLRCDKEKREGDYLAMPHFAWSIIARRTALAK